MDPRVRSSRPTGTFELRRRIGRELEILSEVECLRLLASRDLGRVAIVVDGQPQVFPVNYAVDGGRVVFRTAPGTKLTHGPRSRVAFEVDALDAGAGAAWSVLVQGLAHDVTATLDRASAALGRLPVEPLAPGRRQHWMAVYPTRITGRRFAIAPSDR